MDKARQDAKTRLRHAQWRLALEQVDRLLHGWARTGEVAPGDAEDAATQAERSGDEVLKARAQLLTAAAGAELREPEDALHGLGAALPVFEAHRMARERDQATLLAASLLIDTGCADAALALLAGEDTDDRHAPDPEGPCQRHALRACALQEQGRLVDAVAAARAATNALDPVHTSPRVQGQLAALCAEVLLAARLQSLGIATHLSLYADAPTGAPADGTEARTGPEPPAPAAPGWAPALRDVQALRPWLTGPSAEACSLLLLEDAATQPGNPALLAGLGRLTTRATGDFNHAAGLRWLRLGTAYRLQGQAHLAADGLRRAISLGIQAGQERLVCRAQFELSHTLPGLDDYAGAFSAQTALKACTVRRLKARPRR